MIKWIHVFCPACGEWITKGKGHTAIWYAYHLNKHYLKEHCK